MVANNHDASVMLSNMAVQLLFADEKNESFVRRYLGTKGCFGADADAIIATARKMRDEGSNP